MVGDSEMEKKCNRCGTAPLTPIQRHCHECGAQLRTLDNEEVLNYGACPACGKYSTLKVTSTMKPHRFLKCLKCGYTAKTVEVFLSHPDALLVANEILSGSKIY